MPYDEKESRARGWHLCRRQGYCYCCSQILLSPVRIWWMNHLAIGQACTTLSLQQKRHSPEGSRVCSKAALNIYTLTDKVAYLKFWKHLDLHLLLCAHRSHNKCKHTWVHLTFLPPAYTRKKMKTKLRGILEGVQERQLSKVFLIKSCSEAEVGGEGSEVEGGHGVRTGSLSLDCSLPDTLIC